MKNEAKKPEPKKVIEAADITIKIRRSTRQVIAMAQAKMIERTGASLTVAEMIDQLVKAGIKSKRLR